jgi:hypothetical protein
VNLGQQIQELRAQLQATHTEHIRTELSLCATFMEIYHVERDSGDVLGADLSLKHAGSALRGARMGLASIDSEETRSEFEASIVIAEAELLSYSGNEGEPKES